MLGDDPAGGLERGRRREVGPEMPTAATTTVPLVAGAATPVRPTSSRRSRRSAVRTDASADAALGGADRDARRVSRSRWAMRTAGRAPCPAPRRAAGRGRPPSCGCPAGMSRRPGRPARPASPAGHREVDRLAGELADRQQGGMGQPDEVGVDIGRRHSGEERAGNPGSVGGPGEQVGVHGAEQPARRRLGGARAGGEVDGGHRRGDWTTRRTRAAARSTACVPVLACIVGPSCRGPVPFRRPGRGFILWNRKVP